MGGSMPKSRTTLLIDRAVLQKAKSLGINVSQFTENALRKAIKALETAFGESHQEQQRKDSNPPTRNSNTAGVAESGQRCQLEGLVP